jgi:exodeoxyribonuclease VII small subunit
VLVPGGAPTYGAATSAETEMAATGAKEDISSLSFEDALAQLEQIVQKLEGGDVPLEDSIRIYERGAALKAYCEKKLKEAELKVEKIVLGPDGPAGVERADDL